MFAALLLFKSAALNCQEDEYKVNDYASVFTGIDFGNSTIAWGLEYERQFVKNAKIGLGAKALCIFPHRYENLAFFGPSSDDYGRFKSALMGTVSLYPGKDVNSTGFFFTTSAGAVLINDKIKNQYKYEYSNRISFAAEFGAGLEFDLDEGTHMRLGAAINAGIFRGNFTSAKLSFGF